MRNLNLQNVITKQTGIVNNISALLDPIIISDNMNYVYSDVFNILNEIIVHYATTAYIESCKAPYTLLREKCGNMTN